MWQIFTAHSKYTKRARLAAILWTLLIFIACFLPGNEIPHVRVPFADKWTHCVLFGVFCFLWLLSYPPPHIKKILLIFFVSVLLGWLVEEIQGLLSFLGRSRDIMDMLADTVGSVIGTIVFYILSLFARKNFKADL